ncbi:MAG TPA: HAMP domain-containing sensor histidine kinase [Acidimicrobiales bacterium]|nr:HAMP domain-containing sensor histidine kinase [Acidimicrobiales bacterium]
MTDRPSDPRSRWPGGESVSPARPRPPDARRRVRRRLLLVALALVVAWMVPITIMGVATGYWSDPGHPRGVMGAVSFTGVAAVAVAYRRISRPVGDLLGAAEQVGAGDYEVDVEVRGPRELRRLTETFNEMAARLAANEEQRRRFLADITHELRNPLAVLLSEIEAQMDGVHPRDDRHVASLLEETRRLGHLVDDLHTLALAETGRLVLQQEAVAFGVLVDEVVGRHEAQARQRDVALRASIAAGLPKAWVDPARVRQVLDNLLANAIRHTPAGGEVLVEVSTLLGPGSGDGPMVRCRVTDAGPGFREDQLGQMFERFERAGDSGGSGLGLSIARDLVRAHGGTIDASNDPTTGGASVSFTLPT